MSRRRDTQNSEISEKSAWLSYRILGFEIAPDGLFDRDGRELFGDAVLTSRIAPVDIVEPILAGVTQASPVARGTIVAHAGPTSDGSSAGTSEDSGNPGMGVDDLNHRSSAAESRQRAVRANTTSVGHEMAIDRPNPTPIRRDDGDRSPRILRLSGLTRMCNWLVSRSVSFLDRTSRTVLRSDEERAQLIWIKRSMCFTPSLNMQTKVVEPFYNTNITYEKGRNRAEQIASLIAIALLTKSDKGLTCALEGMMDGHNTSLHFGAIALDGSSIQSGTMGRVATLPSPSIRMTLSKLTELLNDDPMRPLTRIMMPAKKRSELERQVSDAAICFTRAFHYREPLDQIRGAVTTMDLLLGKANDKFSQLKTRIETLVGGDDAYGSQIEVIFNARNAYVHEGTGSADSTLANKALALAASCIIRSAECAPALSTKHDLLQYLDLLHTLRGLSARVVSACIGNELPLPVHTPALVPFRWV